MANLTDDNGVLLEIPFGKLLSDPSYVVIGAEKQPPSEAAYLYGFSQDGFYLALKEATFAGGRSSYPGGSSQKIRGDFLLASRSQFDPAAVIAAAHLSCRGLKEWVCETPLIQKIFPSGSVAMEWNKHDLEKLNEPIYSGEKYCIRIEHKIVTSTLTPEGAGFSHDCSLVIDFREGSDFKDAISLIGSISRFVSLCIGGLAEISEVDFEFAGAENRVSCYANFMKSAATALPNQNEIPFLYPRIQCSIESLIGKWLKLDGGTAEASNMTISLLIKEDILPVDLQFIAATQALEAFVDDGSDTLAEREEDFESRKKRILKSIPDAEDRRWLSDRFPRNTKGQARRLGEFCDANAEIFDWVVPDVEGFKKCQVATRNQNTHRANKKPSEVSSVLSGENLYWHTQAIILICYCYIWKLLGMNPEDIIQALEASHFRQYVRTHAKRLYQDAISS